MWLQMANVGILIPKILNGCSTLNCWPGYSRPLIFNQRLIYLLLLWITNCLFFCSFRPDPEAWCINAFTISWTNKKLYHVFSSFQVYFTGAAENHSGSGNLCGSGSRLADPSMVPSADISSHPSSSQASPLKESTETTSNTNNCIPSSQEHVSFSICLLSTRLLAWGNNCSVPVPSKEVDRILQRKEVWCSLSRYTCSPWLMGADCPTAPWTQLEVCYPLSFSLISTHRSQLANFPVKWSVLWKGFEKFALPWLDTRLLGI